MLGRQAFTVRGIMKSSGLTSAFGGNLAIMDIYAAQKMFGRGRTFDRIDIGAEARAARSREAEARAAAAARAGFQVEPPSGRGQQFEAMLGRLLDDGQHLEPVRAVHRDVHHLQLVRDRGHAAPHRRSAILRALGATAPQIAGCSSARAPVTGLIGSVGGVVVRAADRARHRRVDRQHCSATSTASRSAPTRSRRARALLVAWRRASASRPAWSAAVIPARSAARVDPVQALQKGKYQVLSAGESRGSRDPGASSGAVSRRVCARRGAIARPVLCRLHLCVILRPAARPLLSLRLARALRARCCKWLRPVEGALAADSLIQSPRRTSASVAALMLSLALVIGLAGIARASYTRSSTGWARR